MKTLEIAEIHLSSRVLMTAHEGRKHESFLCRWAIRRRRCFVVDYTWRRMPRCMEMTRWQVGVRDRIEVEVETQEMWGFFLLMLFTRVTSYRCPRKAPLFKWPTDCFKIVIMMYDFLPYLIYSINLTLARDRVFLH